MTNKDMPISENNEQRVSKVECINLDEIKNENTSIVSGHEDFETQNGCEIETNFFCEDCSMKFLKHNDFKKHLRGSKHQKGINKKLLAEMIELKDPSIYCEICNLFTTANTMKFHIQGGRHKRKSNIKSLDESVLKKRNISSAETTMDHCGLCQIDLSTSTEAVKHYQSEDHAKHHLFHCKTCDIFCFDGNAFDFHMKGPHRNKINENIVINTEIDKAEKKISKRNRKHRNRPRNNASSTEKYRFESDTNAAHSLFGQSVNDFIEQSIENDAANSLLEQSVNEFIEQSIENDAANSLLEQSVNEFIEQSIENEID